MRAWRFKEWRVLRIFMDGWERCPPRPVVQFIGMFIALLVAAEPFAAERKAWDGVESKRFESGDVLQLGD